jgi:hypothetical protein
MCDDLLGVSVRRAWKNVGGQRERKPLTQMPGTKVQNTRAPVLRNKSQRGQTKRKRKAQAS